MTIIRRPMAAAILVAGITSVSAAQSKPAPIGTWRGTSLCLVRPSACRDEVVVYRIARLAPADSVSVDGRKIVNGQEQEMGVLPCSFASATGGLTCAMPNGTWKFSVRGDSLVGELRLPDGSKFRDVRTARERATPSPIDRGPFCGVEWSVSDCLIG